MATLKTEERKPETGKELIENLIAADFIGMWKERTDAYAFAKKPKGSAGY